MKIAVMSGSDGSHSAVLTIESADEHRRITEILDRPHEWPTFQDVVDQRRLARERERSEQEQQAAQNEDHREWLNRLRVGQAKVEESLANDPTDAKYNWDDSQKTLRAQLRRDLARDRLGIDLPAAHRDLVTTINQQSNAGGYGLELDEERMLVLLGLGRAWLADQRAERRKRNQTTGIQPQKVEAGPEPPPEEISFEKLFENSVLNVIARHAGGPEGLVQRCKQKALVKTLVKTKVKVKQPMQRRRR